MNFKTRRILAALSAAVCAASTAAAMPVTAEDKPGVTAVYATDFEDGDVSAFSKRGDTDTSVLGTAEDADAPSGKTVMTVTERSKGWNGPQIQVDTICEPGVRYTASCWVKAEWYNSCKLSMQYTDADGEVHYGNLAEATSSGDWKQIPETKFSFSEDMHDVFIYVEANDACNLYVDDFAIKTTPSYTIQSDVPSLKNVYADCFKIGGAVTADELSPLATKQLIMKHYNSITLGNELKPENMLDKEACQALAADGDETGRFPQGQCQNDPEFLPRQQHAGARSCPGMAFPDTGLVLQGRLRPGGRLGGQGNDARQNGELHQECPGRDRRGISGCGILRMGRCQ